jgi:DNA-binding transcriptional regulator YiaG
MEIKELRTKTKMSQSKFANYFNIPVSTLQDWEHNRRTPPVYVVEMIEKIIRYENLEM